MLDQAAEVVPLAGRADYWIEEGSTLSPEQVEAQAESLPWQPRLAGERYALHGRAMWVRFRAQAPHDIPWFLVIGTAGTDRAQLFHRAADGSLVSQEAGDTRPVAQWPLPGRTPAFPLAQGAQQAVSYLLRIEHGRAAFGSPLELHSQGRLFALRQGEHLLLGAAFGLAVLLGVAALSNAVASRDRNFAAFAVYLLIFMLGQAAYTGIAAQYLWGSWLEWNAVATFLLPSLSAPAALWFVQVATEPARFSRRLDVAVRWLAATLVVVVLLETLVPSRAASTVRLLLTAVVVAALAVLLVLAWRKADEPGIRWIALAFLPVLALALFPIARSLGLVPNSAFTHFGLLLGGTLQMPMLFHALSLRGARRREGQWRASALPHTDVLTGLADRATLLQRLGESLHRARLQQQSCALLVVRLANHDAIASEHGRDVLDRALVVTASHLRRCAADIDLAARVGEREFALLLEAPAAADTAIARAQQLVASGLRAAEALPPGLTLRLLVAAAVLPADQGDANATLHWALAALAAMPADARKQIRAMNF